MRVYTYISSSRTVSETIIALIIVVIGWSFWSFASGGLRMIKDAWSVSRSVKNISDFVLDTFDVVILRGFRIDSIYYFVLFSVALRHHFAGPMDVFESNHHIAIHSTTSGFSSTNDRLIRTRLLRWLLCMTSFSCVSARTRPWLRYKASDIIFQALTPSMEAGCSPGDLMSVCVVFRRLRDAICHRTLMSR